MWWSIFLKGNGDTQQVYFLISFISTRNFIELDSHRLLKLPDWTNYLWTLLWPVCKEQLVQMCHANIGERCFLTCDSRVSRDRRHHCRQQQQDSMLGMGVSKSLEPQRQPRSRGDGSCHGAWWRSQVRPFHPVGKTRFIPQWWLVGGVTWGQGPSVRGLSFRNMCTHHGKAVKHKTTTFDYLSDALPHRQATWI